MLGRILTLLITVTHYRIHMIIITFYVEHDTSYALHIVYCPVTLTACFSQCINSILSVVLLNYYGPYKTMLRYKTYHGTSRHFS